GVQTCALPIFEQVVRIIRSKGVGVYFCSQFPDDVPDEILGQLGNRIQHALRAYTPRDQKAVRTAAETFVPNPALDTGATISTLGTGGGLVSTLQANGAPRRVARTLVAPPRCRMGALAPGGRAAIMCRSPVGPRYDTTINRESAEEILARRVETAAIQANAPEAGTAPGARGMGQAIRDAVFGTARRQGM